MLVAEFTVPGPPVAWARPRLGKRGPHGATFHTAEADKRHRRDIALCAAGGALRPPHVLDEALRITVLFVLPVPSSTSAKRREAMTNGRERPTGKPDVDNLLKAVKDALKGVLYRDDSLIVEAAVWKHYGDEPRTEVQLFTVLQPATTESAPSVKPAPKVQRRAQQLPLQSRDDTPTEGTVPLA